MTTEDIMRRLAQATRLWRATPRDPTAVKSAREDAMSVFFNIPKDKQQEFVDDHPQAYELAFTEVRDWNEPMVEAAEIEVEGYLGEEEVIGNPHSPEPWRIHGDPRREDAYILSGEGPGAKVVAIIPVSPPVYELVGRFEEREANARLIINAPLAGELLAALEDTTRALDDASSVVDPGEDEKYAYQRELESARALIERAHRLRASANPHAADGGEENPRRLVDERTCLIGIARLRDLVEYTEYLMQQHGRGYAEVHRLAKEYLDSVGMDIGRETLRELPTIPGSNPRRRAPALPEVETRSPREQAWVEVDDELGELENDLEEARRFAERERYIEMNERLERAIRRVYVIYGIATGMEVSGTLSRDESEEVRAAAAGLEHVMTQEEPVGSARRGAAPLEALRAKVRAIMGA